MSGSRKARRNRSANWRFSDGVTLQPTKCVGIVVVSRELIKLTVPGAEAIVARHAHRGSDQFYRSEFSGSHVDGDRQRSPWFGERPLRRRSLDVELRDRSANTPGRLFRRPTAGAGARTDYERGACGRDRLETHDARHSAAITDLQKSQIDIPNRPSWFSNHSIPRLRTSICTPTIPGTSDRVRPANTRISVGRESLRESSPGVCALRRTGCRIAC